MPDKCIICKGETLNAFGDLGDDFIIVVTKCKRCGHRIENVFARSDYDEGTHDR